MIERHNKPIGWLLQQARDEMPTATWRKADIQAWMDRHSEPYDAGETKEQLLARIRNPPPRDL